VQKIKIALAQISAKRENKRENLRKIEEYTKKAQKQGANLVVFPELALTGYVVRDQIYELAETIPGPSTRVVEEIARKTGVHIIFGMPELIGIAKATIFNTAVLVGTNGIIGKYRKMYLPTHSTFEEKRYFRAGYQTTSFQTLVGTIGLCVCYDLFFPEVCRLTRLKGAQLIVAISASPAIRKNYFEILTTARALENTAFLAYVNLVGVEDGLQFWGGSRLVSPTGEILAKARLNDEDLITQEIDYDDIRPAEAFIPVLKDIRPELFEELEKQSRVL
jgi:predicted amidohydrolase